MTFASPSASSSAPRTSPSSTATVLCAASSSSPPSRLVRPAPSAPATSSTLLVLVRELAVLPPSISHALDVTVVTAVIPFAVAELELDLLAFLELASRVALKHFPPDPTRRRFVAHLDFRSRRSRHRDGRSVHVEN